MNSDIISILTGKYLKLNIYFSCTLG